MGGKDMSWVKQAWSWFTSGIFGLIAVIVFWKIGGSFLETIVGWKINLTGIYWLDLFLNFLLLIIATGVLGAIVQGISSGLKKVAFTAEGPEAIIFINDEKEGGIVVILSQEESEIDGEIYVKCFLPHVPSSITGNGFVWKKNSKKLRLTGRPAKASLWSFMVFLTDFPEVIKTLSALNKMSREEQGNKVDKT